MLTVFIQIVAMATINFCLARMQPLISGKIPCSDIKKNSNTIDWFIKAVLQEIEI